MDGKKKKKRNRRKKGANKLTDDSDAAPNGGKAAAAPAEPDHGSCHCQNQNHEELVPAAAEPRDGPAAEQNHHVQVPAPELSQAPVAAQSHPSESNIEIERHNMCEARWAYLEEKLRHLQSEVAACTKKEASLEDNLRGLQAGSDSSMQKQHHYLKEEKEMGELLSTYLRNKVVLLEANIKRIEDRENSWNLKEISIKEMIARLDEVNVGLQLQVSELTEFRDSFLQENQQLKETISVLESKIQHLERNASFSGSSIVKTAEMPEEKNLIYQAETSREPVENQDADNAMLDKVAHELHDEKVNEVHIKMNQHAIATEPTITELDHVTVPTRAAPSHDHASGHGDSYRSFEQIHETFNNQHGAADYGSVTRLRQVQISDLDESRISEDVVSVSLDDIQVDDSEQTAMRTVENSPAPISGSQELPLSDAPLIGAPFRLISYFAKYVTGADLVNQK